MFLRGLTFDFNLKIFNPPQLCHPSSTLSSRPEQIITIVMICGVEGPCVSSHPNSVIPTEVEGSAVSPALAGTAGFSAPQDRKTVLLRSKVGYPAGLSGWAIRLGYPAGLSVDTP